MKLVRDEIPRIITDSGRVCTWRRVATREEHMEGLRAKILEEADEFIENPCEEEAADMLEVLFAFTHLNGIDFEDVLEVAREKAEERGGFYKGIILQEVLNETG